MHVSVGATEHNMSYVQWSTHARHTYTCTYITCKLDPPLTAYTVSGSTIIEYILYIYIYIIECR
jgi:hypothetical protein